MDRLAERAIKKVGCSDQFRHWSLVWMAMPEIAYRLAYCVAEVRLDESRAPLLQEAFAAAGRTMDGWLSSTSTLQLVRDAIRAMFEVCLELGQYEVSVDGQPWRPGVDGPLGEILARRPMAVVQSHESLEGASARLAGVLELLSQNVFGDLCQLTLRRSYSQLMQLGEPA